MQCCATPSHALLCDDIDILPNCHQSNEDDKKEDTPYAMQVSNKHLTSHNSPLLCFRSIARLLTHHHSHTQKFAQMKRSPQRQPTMLQRIQVIKNKNTRTSGQEPQLTHTFPPSPAPFSSRRLCSFSIFRVSRTNPLKSSFLLLAVVSHGFCLTRIRSRDPLLTLQRRWALKVKKKSTPLSRE